ncbi:YraN family protein [Sediminibacterium ginsengisoli]|uniref:UPF0102 protein SAMN04488132_10645 n=1 Tax=Sediminibacterium ginsengisoli TaxID=413434 RepID=A0A1T4PJ47_9BACT|nr:YraN family protein [Sediminibacterium ginsengisoli]SJZ91605.1 putative endonuclease [Sediminibacterium ginsengisoli]
MKNNKHTGSAGEQHAVDFLTRSGYEVLERNWRFRHWEVDIIASRNGKLHFVEVKTRTSHRFGHPEESITMEKMRHLRNAAEEYQYRHPEWKYIQFDVLAITFQDNILKEVFLIEDVYF